MMLALLALLAAQDRIPEPKLDPCREYIGPGYTVAIQPAVPRQGETVELIPMFVQFYGMPPAPVPPECARDWQIKGEGAKLVRGNRLKISAKAVPGTTIQYSAQIGGKDGGRGYGGFKVIGKAQKVLSGKFSVTQQQGCQTAKIAEVTFSSNGYYSYTMPEDMFETKVTGSGLYRWDGDSGRLDLGGRDEPFRAERTATAKWLDGALVLEGWDPHGSAAGCRITLLGSG